MAELNHLFPYFTKLHFVCRNRPMAQSLILQRQQNEITKSKTMHQTLGEQVRNIRACNCVQP